MKRTQADKVYPQAPIAECPEHVVRSCVRLRYTPDPADGIRAFRGADTAGHLLLDLHHADIPLRLIVIKRNSKIVHKRQHSLLVITEPIQQIFGWALLGWKHRGHRLISAWCSVTSTFTTGKSNTCRFSCLLAFTSSSTV